MVRGHKRRHNRAKTVYSLNQSFESDNKKKARLNCISHLLDLIDYHEIEHPEVIMPDRVQQQNYERPPRSSYNYVPEVI